MYCLKGYIARDEDNALCFHYSKPKRIIPDNEIYSWWYSDSKSFEISRDLYPNLKWGNEPVKAELTIRLV